MGQIYDPVFVKAPYFSTSRLQLIEYKYKPSWTTCEKNWYAEIIH